MDISIAMTKLELHKLQKLLLLGFYQGSCVFLYDTV